MKIKIVAIALLATILVLGACSTNPKSIGDALVEESDVKAESPAEKEVEPETTSLEESVDSEKEIELSYVIPDDLKDSFKMDKNRVYTYESINEVFTQSYVSQADQETEWEIWNNGDFDYIHNEDENGLYTGWIDANYYIDIKYPVFIGQEWEPTYEIEGTYKIINVDETIETKAGTFSNVITVEEEAGYKLYYAGGIGFIKSEQDGNVVTELIKLEKR
ncbi:hypothetical protein ACI2JA_06415 [Alkalihalobacillus sp. NPDC078783]